MKKYKKFLAVLMVITMVFSVISCGKALEQGGTPEQNNDMPSTVQSDNIENNSGETKATNDVDDAVQVSEEDVKTGTVIEEDGTVRQTDTFVSEDGWVTFDVDAVVEGYDITELPIISVVPNHYDSAELEQISKAMARGNTIYGYTEEFTKDELLAIRKDYSDLIEGYRTRSADGAINATDEEIEASIAVWQGYIDVIDKELENAPDEWYYTEPVYEYGAESRYSEGKEYYRDTCAGENTFRALYEENGRSMDIYAYDNTQEVMAGEFGLEGDEVYNMNGNAIYTNASIWRNESNYNTGIQPEPFTDDEIQSAADEVISVVADMGIGEWKITNNNVYVPREEYGETDYTLSFYLYPSFYNVPVVDGLSGWVYDVDKKHDIPAFSEGPYMDVGYNQDGITNIGLYNDIDVISETEPKELITYEEALETIYGYAAKRWDFSSVQISPYQKVQDENYAYTIHINKISLEYIRTVSGDAPDHYDIIPVWVVYGHPNVVKYYIGNTAIEGVSTVPGYQGDAEDSMMPMMMINAYDGTQITSEHSLLR